MENQIDSNNILINNNKYEKIDYKSDNSITTNKSSKSLLEENSQLKNQLKLMIDMKSPHSQNTINYQIDEN